MFVGSLVLVEYWWRIRNANGDDRVFAQRLMMSGLHVFSHIRGSCYGIIMDIVKSAGFVIVQTSHMVYE